MKKFLTDKQMFILFALAILFLLILCGCGLNTATHGYNYYGKTSTLTTFDSVFVIDNETRQVIKACKR